MSVSIVNSEAELPRFPNRNTCFQYMRLGSDEHLEPLIFEGHSRQWIGRTHYAILGNDRWDILHPEIVFADNLQEEMYWGPKDDLWSDVSPQHIGDGYAAGMKFQFRQFAMFHDLNWDGDGADVRMRLGAYLYEFDHNEPTPNWDTQPPTFGWARTEYMQSTPNTDSWWAPSAQPWQWLEAFDDPPTKSILYPAMYGYMEAGAVTSGRAKNPVLELRWAIDWSEAMANYQYNVSYGRERTFYDNVNNSTPANAGFLWVALVVNRPTITDDTLRDFDTLSALLADANVAEATNTNYARKIVTDADLAASAVDDTNNRMDLDIPNPLWDPGPAAGDDWTDLSLFYCPDVTAIVDADCIPFTNHNFPWEANGSPVEGNVNVAGFFRMQPQT
jgi:hypothetical protein